MTKLIIKLTVNLPAHLVVCDNTDEGEDTIVLFKLVAGQLTSPSTADARSTTLAAIRNKSAASARPQLFGSSADGRGETPHRCLA